MSDYLDWLDSKLNNMSGVTSFNNGNQSSDDDANIKKIYDTIDTMTEEQIDRLQKKVSMRKERLQFLREHEQPPKSY